MNEERRYTARAHPSLALAKYWGKLDRRLNTPATTSIGVSLAAFHCTVTIMAPKNAKEDICLREGKLVECEEQMRSLLVAFRSEYTVPLLLIDSTSNIPFAAGLAGSSAFFAALAAAIACFLEQEGGYTIPAERISLFARIGSASAARSVFGGFHRLPRGGKYAEPIFPASYWPELRVVCVVVHDVQKSISSREAMNQCADTSPLYNAWCSFANKSAIAILAALQERKLETLGRLLVQQAYSMMGSMLASNPPIRYWTPQSLAVLNTVAELRNEGFSVWETMDAGPQVKLLCEAPEATAIIQKIQKLQAAFPDLRIECSGIGAGVFSWSE